jgi:peroxiredoxin
VREAPHLVEVQDTYKAKGLRLIGVTKATREDTRRFGADQKVNYALLAEAEADQLAYGVKLVWGTRYFLVDPDGTVVAQELDVIEQRLAAELG